MRKFITCFQVSLFVFLINGMTQVPFTAGNVVVYRVGTGTTNLTSATFAVFLDEYTPAGVKVQSIALPIAVSGANKILTAVGNGNTEGAITLSSDGQYVVCTGYNTAPATTGVGGSSSATRPRTIGVIKYDGTINTTTALTDLSSGGPVRSATTSDGIHLWSCGNGTGSGSGGVRYAAVGATTSTQLNSAGTGQLRNVFIVAGQLYVAGNSSSPRIGTVGTGLPTTTGQTITNLSGFPTNISPGQFVLLDLNAGVAGPDVIYYTDDGAGIEKYSLVSGNWISNGTVGGNSDDYRGLTARAAGNVVTIYATRKGPNAGSIEGGELVKLTDPIGYNGTFSGTPTVIATTVSTDQAAFRGVALAPVQAVVTPIKLISFTADKINNDVRLGWIAVQAIDFSHFEVERSTDGKTFSVVGKVDLRGTDSSEADYSFTDAGILTTVPMYSNLYYRLKMVDVDGHADYSKLAIINLNQLITKPIQAYPNPFSGKISINVNMVRAGNARIAVIDGSGRKIRSKQLLLQRGENLITLTDLGPLQKGAYTLRVQVNDKVTSLKLFK